MKAKRLCIRIFVLGIFGLFAAGCASPREYSHISSQFPPISAGEGRMIIYRGSEFYGGGQWDTVWLDGKTVGYLSSRSFFYLDEPAGDYTISGRPKGSLIFKISGQWKELPITLKADETKYICFKQIYNVSAPIPKPTLEDTDSAMKELPSYLYFEGKYHAF